MAIEMTIHENTFPVLNCMILGAVQEVVAVIADKAVDGIAALDLESIKTVNQMHMVWYDK